MLYWHTMGDCIFCKIIRGELPATKVYEDEQCVAFLDIHPTAPGHTLVVPKTHGEDLLGCAPEAAASMIKAAQKIAPAIAKATGAEGFNLGVNNGRAAGQIIFHLHMHIIPRRSDDGLKSWGHRDYAEGEMVRIADQIRARL